MAGGIDIDAILKGLAFVADHTPDGSLPREAAIRSG